MPTFVSAAKWIPEAVQRLCGFHVGQAMWRWLWNAKNGIIFEDRQEIIKRFMPLLRMNRGAFYRRDQLTIAALVSVRSESDYGVVYLG